ncbi:MAG: TerB family tellurite resistance protein [Leptolyngbyaceae cyanobacterium SM2_3_12]|nr:TerB family tellurite resistance protein [Leptolyngbyaceae cyanobacterium SM2_3_12]
MSIQPPSPPSISPNQMTLLRVVATMAWSDGHLADEEVDVMLDQFSQLFAKETTQKEALRAELRDYVMQNIPLDELVPRLTTQAERELVLKLGYQVISASALTPNEALINQAEAEAYQSLVALLNLPEDVVQRVEQQGDQVAGEYDNLIDHMTTELRIFMQNQ